jgi:hypothetical protein
MEIYRLKRTRNVGCGRIVAIIPIEARTITTVVSHLTNWRYRGQLSNILVVATPDQVPLRCPFSLCCFNTVRAATSAVRFP